MAVIKQMPTRHSALQALTAAALILPGLLQSPAHADNDSVDFQYSHYQEGKREGINRVITNQSTGVTGKYAVANDRKPIEVDSLHGSAKVTLTDRIKFAFNFTQDTWSGATPLGSAPEGSGANGRRTVFPVIDYGTSLVTGASPYANAQTYLDNQGNPLYQVIDPVTRQTSYIKDRTVHVMSYASPETRQQGDFKLGYQWAESALDIGGGISTERDYESRFVNLGGRMDFNQKQTTANLGLSYTNSAISAVLDPMGVGNFAWSEQHNHFVSKDTYANKNTLNATREDWSSHLGLTHAINKNALFELGMGYARNTGFLENPYKLSWIFGVNPDIQSGLPEGIRKAQGGAYIEQRPDSRNQLNGSARWVQYVAPLDAALHVEYQFAHDDWDINAHTVAADWVQPLGVGWALTPRVRYYSQDAAYFYRPFFIVNTSAVALANPNFPLPDNFSSDQRLSAYGALSGGVTVSKQFAKGIGIEAGFEYYTHQGDLKLGGGGEKAFADFDYWVANAALKLDLSTIGQHGASGGQHNAVPMAHSNSPAGILFAHTLEKAGDSMIDYRYMRSMQSGDILHGSEASSQERVVSKACPGSVRREISSDGITHFDGGCRSLPAAMTMNMHMLEFMVAPTNRLTLMLMPQFVDMAMASKLVNAFSHDIDGHGAHAHGHETGGIGDTGMYALIKLFDTPQHHIHTSLGFSAPTGDAGIKLIDRTKDLGGAYIDYGMQLGSGTWDFKPSLTYTGKIDAWHWGGQIGGTKRIDDRNASGYILGDMFATSLWGGYDLTHWLSASIRAAYNWQGNINGKYPRSTRLDSQLYICQKTDYTYTDDNGTEIFDHAGYSSCLKEVEITKRVYDSKDRSSPVDFPKNYGGHYVDIGFGLNATIPNGAFAGNRLSVEWLQPVHTDVNGYQLDRDGTLAVNWDMAFD